MHLGQPRCLPTTVLHERKVLTGYEPRALTVSVISYQVRLYIESILSNASSHFCQMGQDSYPEYPNLHLHLDRSSGCSGNSLPPDHKASGSRLPPERTVWKLAGTPMTLGGENSTSTSKSVGFNLGTPLSVPMKTRPRPMENDQITWI